MVMNIKKSIKILGLAILVEAFTQIYAGAQGTSPSPFSFNSDVYLDYVSVLKGISRTSGVMGNIDAQVSFDTEKAK
jgi:hypothetical protein